MRIQTSWSRLLTSWPPPLCQAPRLSKRFVPPATWSPARRVLRPGDLAEVGSRQFQKKRTRRRTVGLEDQKLGLIRASPKPLRIPSILPVHGSAARPGKVLPSPPAGSQTFPRKGHWLCRNSYANCRCAPGSYSERQYTWIGAQSRKPEPHCSTRGHEHTPPAITLYLTRRGDSFLILKGMTA